MFLREEQQIFCRYDVVLCLQRSNRCAGASVCLTSMRKKINGLSSRCSVDLRMSGIFFRPHVSSQAFTLPCDGWGRLVLHKLAEQLLRLDGPLQASHQLCTLALAVRKKLAKDHDNDHDNAESRQITPLTFEISHNTSCVWQRIV